MSRFLTAALVGVLTIAACDSDSDPPTPPPPVTGSVSGTVTVGGQVFPGVTVGLSSGGATQVTDAQGAYSFQGVPEGTHQVTISGFPADVSFPSTVASVTISASQTSARADFAGDYLRNSEVLVRVVVTGLGALTAVSVRLEGGPDEVSLSKTPDSGGNARFSGLRAGTYTASIANFDPAIYSFPAIEQSIMAPIAGVGEVSFSGSYRTVGTVTGSVTYEGHPAPGVTVSLYGGISSPPDVSTDAGGNYRFTGIVPGSYTISISSPEADVVFSPNFATVDVSDGTVEAPTFDGNFIRAARASGRVSVGSTPIEGARIEIGGSFSHGSDTLASTMSNSRGDYGFAGLRQGRYFLRVTAPDGTDHDFWGRDSLAFDLAVREVAGGKDFAAHDGRVSGAVTVEDDGALQGVTVSLSASHGVRRAVTGGDGTFVFAGLRPATYTVSVEGFDERRYEFSPSAREVRLAASGRERVRFEGTLRAVASISGTVTYEGVSAPGVTVTLSGGPTDHAPVTTGTNGGYSFSALKPGSYAVEISGFLDYVNFRQTRRTYDVDGQLTADPFNGQFQRTSRISGKITAAGRGLEGARIQLKGSFDYGKDTMAVATAERDGSYAFASLRSGSYEVGILDFPKDGRTDFHERDRLIVELLNAGHHRNADFVAHEGVVRGRVIVEGIGPISGVRVELSASHRDDADVTASDGYYRFDGLRPAQYRISLSGHDSTRIIFREPSTTVMVSQDQVSRHDFEGEQRATASISGVVTYEGEPASGVTVSLSGGPTEPPPVSTGADGRYSFSLLKPGSYSVEISNYLDDVRFIQTRRTYDVDGALSADPFSGNFVRTSSISGRVTVAGEAVYGARVELKGTFQYGPDTTATITTDRGGSYSATKLRAGSYRVSLSQLPQGTNADFHGRDSLTVDLASANRYRGADFKAHEGTVRGRVTVSGLGPQGGVVVELGADHIRGNVVDTTNEEGYYRFDGLRPASYSVTIQPDTTLVSFEETSVTVTVSADAVTRRDFMGDQKTTASISGRVTYEGESAPDVTLSLSGGPTNAPPETTGAAGYYLFSDLKPGSYTLTVSNQRGDVSFSPSSRVISAMGKTTAETFDGTFSRTGTISGTVLVDDEPTSGINVRVTGSFDFGPDSVAEQVSLPDGSFVFERLRIGTYQVSVASVPTGYGYDFSESDTSVTITVLDDDADGVDIRGTVATMASISGRLFLDEIENDDTFNPSESGFEQSGVKVRLRMGEEGHQVPFDSTESDAGGGYSFDSLPAGSYVVELDAKSSRIPDGIEPRASRIRSGLLRVGWNSNRTYNFPFRIRTQRIRIHGTIGAATPTGLPKPGHGVPEWDVSIYQTRAEAELGTGVGQIAAGRTGSDGSVRLSFPRSALAESTFDGSRIMIYARAGSFTRDDYSLAAGSDSVVQLSFSKSDTSASASFAATYDRVIVSAEVLMGTGPAATPLPEWTAWVKDTSSTGLNAKTARTNESSGNRANPGELSWEIDRHGRSYPISVFLRVPEDDNTTDGHEESQPGNDGWPTELDMYCDPPGQQTSPCTPNPFSVTPNAVAGTSGVFQASDGRIYLQYTWDGTVPPRKRTIGGIEIPEPDSVKVGGWNVVYDKVDLVVTVHRELDDTVGFTGGDHANPGDVVDELTLVASTGPGSNISPTLDAASGRAAFWDNIVTGTIDLETSVAQAAGWALLGNTTRRVVIDGTRGIVWNRNECGPKECSTFAIKRTDNVVRGKVSTPSAVNVAGVQVTFRPLKGLWDGLTVPADTGWYEITSDDGMYSFDNVPDGPYEVSVPSGTLEIGEREWAFFDTLAADSAGTGWIPDKMEVSAVGNRSATVAWRDVQGDPDEARGDSIVANFRIRRVDTKIRGAVINDRDADNVRDAAEARPRVPITLTPGRGTPGSVRTASTDDFGVFEFPDLPEGSYTLTATSPRDGYQIIAQQKDGLSVSTSFSDSIVWAITDSKHSLGGDALPRWDYGSDIAMFDSDDETSFIAIAENHRLNVVVLDTVGGGTPLRGATIDIHRCKNLQNNTVLNSNAFLRSGSRYLHEYRNGQQVQTCGRGGQPVAKTADTRSGGLATLVPLTEGAYLVTNISYGLKTVAVLGAGRQTGQNPDPTYYEDQDPIYLIKGANPTSGNATVTDTIWVGVSN